MAELPLVSILTPTFRHGAYLRACIDSVLAQTFVNWELLVREDGQLDPGLAADYDDPRIHLSGQEHRGLWRLAETYNELLAEARGELVAVLEGDDLWPADKLEAQVAIHHRRPDVVLSFGEAERIDAHGAALSRWRHEGLPVDEPFDARATLLRGCPIAAVTAMTRRSALVEVGGFAQPEGMPAVDYPTWLALAGNGPFYASSALLGRWRVHETNSSSLHIRALAAGGRKLAVGRASPGERGAVLRRWNRIEGDVEASIGRSALAARDWTQSRAAFRRAVVLRARSRPLPVRGVAKAAAGLALGVLHLSRSPRP